MQCAFGTVEQQMNANSTRAWSVDIRQPIFTFFTYLFEVTHNSRSVVHTSHTYIAVLTPENLKVESVLRGQK